MNRNYSPEELKSLEEQVTKASERAARCAVEAQNLLENGPSSMGVEMAKVWSDLAHFHNSQAQTIIMLVGLDG